MKVPINDVNCIDLDAPTLPAWEKIIGGTTRWLVWCRYCKVSHHHGPGEGHREAHCNDPRSPYWKTGYNLALAGPVVL